MPKSKKAAQPDLPGLQFSDGPSQAARRPPRLSLPPVELFVTDDQLCDAIGKLEPYLAELRRRRGSLVGNKASATLRAKKRPSAADLNAFIDGRSKRGAINDAAKRFGVDRKTVARWRKADAAAAKKVGQDCSAFQR